MSILRSTSGEPMVAGGGKPLLRSDLSLSAPASVGGPDELLFDMATARPGVPAVNDQDERFGENRDWEYNWTHPEGFAGVRLKTSWMRSDGHYGSWEPAEAEVFRIQRKGPSGQDAQTLVLTCGPNPAPVPVGDSVVLWEIDGPAGWVKRTTSFALSGYNLPLRTKMTVTSSTPSAPFDERGRRVIEISAGTALPAIDYIVPSVYDDLRDRMSQSMRLRHWSFHADKATNRLRWPLPWFRDNTLELVLPYGGYALLGGLRMLPEGRDWTLDYNDFGASLVEELWRSECEGLAFHFGHTSPRRLAVELEDKPTRPWHSNVEGTDVGYGDLLRDVWYPVARQAWGRERTLGVKATSYGSIDSLRDDFSWTNPSRDNTFLFAHNRDGQIHIGQPGGRLATWSDISETDYAAGVIAEKVAQSGCKGGGMSECGASPYEWWTDEEGNQVPVTETERGRRLGRLLTSLTNRGLSQWTWGMTTDQHNCVGVYQDGLRAVQMYFPGMRPYCARAGRTTT